MDIPDIDMVIQFLVASSLSVWMQRAGRAGRSGTQAYAIIFIEPTVFQPKPAPKPLAAASRGSLTNPLRVKSKGKARVSVAKKPVQLQLTCTQIPAARNVPRQPVATVEIKTEIMEAAEATRQAPMVETGLEASGTAHTATEMPLVAHAASFDMAQSSRLGMLYTIILDQG